MIRRAFIKGMVAIMPTSIMAALVRRGWFFNGVYFIASEGEELNPGDIVPGPWMGTKRLPIIIVEHILTGHGGCAVIL